ncbi:STAS domain-containing protein [Tautonia plasticadhaerens]|uniref:STAS domain protein n=1 Tax=Tautonia plasticadhaerens TaxID=2527974 RepID=A0A518GXD3_9BACT|nr:STAS domain-containing protein [Tautonia plasticadhaerens]QDV33233.1 STAS domain protein [Tautonia plasticadhaerens]
MLSPKVELRTEQGILYAEFWDCLRLDPAPVKDLLSKYKTAAAEGSRPDLIIDFSGVTFAGSAALSGFVNLQRTCRQNGGRILLCNLEPTVSEAFRLSRLDSMFSFVADPPAAFQALDA